MVPSNIFCTRCGTANHAQSAFCFACGQPLQNSALLSKAPATGEADSGHRSRSGQLTPRYVLKQRYRVIARLGNGGFGAVYKAEDALFGNRLVALKEMNRGGLTSQEISGAADAFKREALLLAKLKHPSLPSIYDHFTEAGRWYLVMDYIEGETLEARLERVGRMRVDEVLQVGMQLCEVLGYLHNRQPPVIFRDLKPANIIITPQGHIYLIDFGLARLFEPEPSKNSIPLGSPGYAAPEQYENTQATVRADIYSLGATLHQLLTGVYPSLRPFEFAPIRFPPASPLAGFGTLIMSMLEMNPARRPENMLAVARELQRVANQLREASRKAAPSPDARPPVPPGGASQTPRSGPISQSGKNLSTPPVGTVICAFAGHTAAVNDLSWSPDGEYIATASEDMSVHIWNSMTGAIVQSFRDARQRAVTVAWSPDGSLLATGYAGDKRNPETLQITRALSGEKVFSYASNTGFWSAQADKTISTLAWSPDGARLACGGAEYKIDMFDARIWRQLITYKGHNSAIYTMAWSPDGRQIISTGADDAVHLWDATSGKNIATYFKHSSIVSGVDWSPNGQRIVSASYDKSAQVWNAVTGTAFTTYRGHLDRVQSVAWSPDGTRIATGGRDGSVHIWDANKGTTIMIYTGHKDSINAVRWSPDGKRLASASADKTALVWQA
ncbi:MAG TPA: protein kinase [Ktedonobacteraceae bacterium]|nr:protein kinase [Ktedonobacteraceae bacterium]